MPTISAMPLAQLNEEIKSAVAADKVPGELPEHRNYYILLYKPSAQSAPIEKRFYRKGGFDKTLAFCERYCKIKDYRFLTLVPMFADLDFELSAVEKNKEEK
jgi:hypothetical protein